MIIFTPVLYRLQTKIIILMHVKKTRKLYFNSLHINISILVQNKTGIKTIAIQTLPLANTHN